VARYKILIDDNFHPMDETERSEHGVFDTSAEAVAVCRRIVEDSLRHLRREGMTAAELYEAYTTFGDDPFVVCIGGYERVEFSAWSHAEQRCEALVTLDDVPGGSTEA
jgi:hypothetical protein